METLKVDRTKLITQSAYARRRGVSPQMVTKLIRNKAVKTVPIEGAILILMD